MFKQICKFNRYGSITLITFTLALPLNAENETLKLYRCDVSGTIKCSYCKTSMPLNKEFILKAHSKAQLETALHASMTLSHYVGSSRVPDKIDSRLLNVNCEILP